MKKLLTMLIALLLVTTLALAGCSEKTDTYKDIKATQQVADNLTQNQPTPKDVNYSLERYNLIRRAYWVNGQREKAIAYPCSVTKPLGYIVLFASNGATIGRFIVDGKVSSLNSFLTPNRADLYSDSYLRDVELPDVDGSYGENVSGIFFFTTDGKYIEWTGDFLFSDIPFTIDDPVLKVEGE